MEHMGRYRVVWNMTRRLIPGWTKRRLNYTAVPCEVEGPVLVLANHNTDLDPFLLGLSFPQYLSFVASEHLFRLGLGGKLLVFLFNPIARLKGTSGGNTVLTMLRRLRQGCSVALFPEGNRSFLGRTGEIAPATGKLAKKCGVPVVTYRLEGGYFTSPRWAGMHLRRGKMTGRPVHTYTPEELSQMSVEEVTEAIRRDLFVDAYAEQRKDPVAYEGKNLAVGLETLLYRCPSCGRLGTLQSVGNTLSCPCGFSARFNAFGFFEGDAPFDNLCQWDEAQTRAVLEQLPTDGSPVFSDSQMELKEILPRHKTKLLGRGDMTLYCDRLEVCGLSFLLEDITGFSIIGAQRVSFSAMGRSFEITSKQLRCTRKYMTMIEKLRLSGQE